MSERERTSVERVCVREKRSEWSFIWLMSI